MKIKPVSFENSVNIFPAVSTHVGKSWMTHIPNYEEPTGLETNSKNAFIKQRPSILKWNFNTKLKLETFPEFGQRTPKCLKWKSKIKQGTSTFTRLLGDVHDEEDYDQSMKMIFISSNFAHEIPSHSDSSDADVFPPSSSEEEKIDKTRKLPKRIPSKILQIEAAATIHVQNLWKNSFRQL